MCPVVWMAVSVVDRNHDRLCVCAAVCEEVSNSSELEELADDAKVTTFVVPMEEADTSHLRVACCEEERQKNWIELEEQASSTAIRVLHMGTREIGRAEAEEMYQEKMEEEKKQESEE
ncbi:expressed protein [Echinococcus multilocularis]|uniref:Expressed protein n=3 Tax=Echinococcus multilocularis TaxID=6211 RepID=U6HNX0_ECHMU|nr:expressed protein [Echinococcus multilocularis]CDS36830.1 expressed protein [Echinococcus multilocularis]CDS38250.1 expressed protein [Echinococcus multilocularis]